MWKNVESKEYTSLIRIATAVLTAAALFLLSCGSAGAQVNTSLAGGDFALFQMKDESELKYLYPELVFYHNPALIAEVKRPLLITGLHGRVEENKNTITNVNEFDGFVKEDRDKQNIHPYLHFFLPLNDTWKAGAFLYYRYYKDSIKRENRDIDLDESGSIENYEEKNTEKDTYWTENYFSGSLYLARRSSPVNYGLCFQYEYEYTPVEDFFGTFSSPEFPSGPFYLDDPDTPETGNTIHKPSLTLGGRLRRGPIDLGLALHGKVELDKPRNLFTKDTNGDGFSDELVPPEEFYGWDSFNERGVHPRVYLYPSLVYDISPHFSLIASGKVGLVDYDKYTIEYDRDYTLEKLRRKNMKNYLALAGVEIRPRRTMALRLGGGYEHSGQNVEVEDDGVFLTADSGNTNNYYEVDWGYTPGNNEVVHAVDSHYWEPDEEEHKYFGVVGMEWELGWRMRVFFSSRFSRREEIRTYRVYDRVDGTVWTEQEVEGNTDWVHKSLAGAAFDISDNLLLSVATDWTVYEREWREDGLPRSDSENLEERPEDSSRWELSVHIRFLVGF